MAHDCKQQGWYHKELYNRFKNGYGKISWCTVCGRICKDHHHYKLLPYNVDHTLVTIPPVTETVVFYSSDCKGREGGGGLEEKFLRFRQFKKAAKDLQNEVGEISRAEALKYLVEQMWNAPLVPLRKKEMNRMKTEKAFNVATNNFPANANRTHKNNVEKMKMKVFNPKSGMIYEPKVFPVGSLLTTSAGAASSAVNASNVAENLIGFAGEGNVIYFHHQQLNGVHRDHFSSREGIGEAALIDYIKAGLESFGVDEDFGKCPFHSSTPPVELYYFQ